MRVNTEDDVSVPEASFIRKKNGPSKSGTGL
jgi:hypothetical protein